MTEAMQLICIGLPAAVACAAGAVKLRFRREFASAVVAWGVLPPRGIRPFTTGLPAAEVAAGLAAVLLAALGRPAASAVLLSLFFALLAAGQGVIISTGGRGRCGCFGRWSGNLGVRSVASAAGRAALAAAGAVPLA